jgi:hypothetical protein
MSCFVTYKGVKYSEAQFFALLSSGLYDKLVAEGKFEPKKLTNTSTTERAQQENRAADVTGTEESEFLKNFKENITTPIKIKEMLEAMGVSKDTLANSKVIEQANEALAEYKDIDNIRDIIDRITSDVDSGALSDAIGEAIVALLIKETAMEMKKFQEEGNASKEESLFQTQAELIAAFSKQGTDIGRALQIRKALANYMFNDPYLADYFHRKAIEKSNAETKKDPVLKESAQEIVDKIKEAKEAAKKKVAGAIIKDVNAALEREMRKGLTNISEAKKNQVKSFFNKLRVDESKSLNNKTLSAIIPVNVIIDPKKYNKFVDLVEKLVLGGMNLGIAITKASTDLFKSDPEGYSLKNLGAMKKILTETIKGTQNPKVKTKLQIEREAANAELKAAKEEYNAKQKEIKDAKEKARLADEEVQKVLDSVERENFKRIVAKQEELKKQREKLAADKIKERQELESEIIRLEEKNQKALAAAEQKISDAVEKENFKRLVNEAKEYEKAQKQLDKDIQRLAKEVIDAAKKSETNSIEAIIDMFYSKEDQLQSDLEEMVVTALGVSPQEAVKIAEKIKDAMETQLRAGLIKQFENSIGKQAVALTEAEIEAEKKKRGYLSPFLGKYEGTVKKQGGIIDKMLRLSMLGVLNTNDIMDLMKEKYGIQTFTLEMANYIKSQAIKINKAETQGRKNKELAKMTDKMAELAPLYYHEMMNSLWYNAVLSGLGTQDANLTFNINQIKNSAIRALSVSIFNNLTKRDGGSVIDRSKSIINDIGVMLLRGVYQDKASTDMLRNLNTLKGIEALIPLSSSTTNLLFTLKEGTTSFAENEKAVETQSQSEVDYGRYSKIFGLLNFSKIIGRTLNAVDTFSRNLLLNIWVVPILREEYRKQGLNPRAIDAKIKQELLYNKVLIEVARNKAINDIIAYDITVVQKNGKWEVQYDGKKVYVKDTEAEANNYIEKAAKAQRVAIDRFANEILQNNINEKALKAASHLSQETIMSSAPSGVATSTVYNLILNLKSNITKMAKQAEKEARASNKMGEKFVKGFEARAEYWFMRAVLPAFIKMYINLIDNYFIKDNPIGYLTARKAGKIALNPVSKKDKKIADFYQSDVQIDDLKARAIIGTLKLIPIIAIVGWLMSQFRPDDEEKKRRAAAKRLSRKNDIDETYIDEIEKASGGYEGTNSPYLLVPTNGEKFGSLDFLDPKMKKALENAGLAKEHSVYVGEFPNGKFESLVANPSDFNFGTTIENTLAMLVKYKKDNKGDKIADEAFENSTMSLLFDSFLYSALSFGSFSITKRSKNVIERVVRGETLDVVAEAVSAFFPETTVSNPNFLKQNIKYIDGRARQTIKPTADFSTYLGTQVPLMGSFVSTYGAEKRYGMFGEEMYSVPAMVQGAVSGYYFDYMFGDKNQREKKMYQFLAANNYNKIMSMPNTLSKMDLNGKEVLITPEEQNRLGAAAGKNVLSKLEEKKDFILSLPIPVAKKYIDDVFNIEFKDAWQKETGFRKDNTKKEKEYAAAIVSTERRTKALGEFVEFIKEHKVTDDELDFQVYLRKHKSMKIAECTKKLEETTSPFALIDRWYEIKTITKEERKELDADITRIKEQGY